MKTEAEQTRKRWLAIAGGAAVAMLGVLALFRGPAAGPMPPAVPASEIGVALTRLQPGESGALEQQAMLGDPTPLFLPTDWNFGQGVLPESVVREPGQQFKMFAPKFAYGEADLELRLPGSVAVPATAAMAVNQMTEATLSGLGRVDRPPPSLPVRAAYLEVRRAEDGVRVWNEALVNAQPPGARFWQPAEFLVAVDVAGLIGPPVPTVRTGVDEVDDYLQAYLKTGVQIGARLSPGLYRISIGP